MAPHIAFRVLQVAERCDFTIVEDDVFSDLQRALTPRLATLDQLNRVIYVRSFTKTLSGSLRVGFVASRPNLIESLADIKMSDQHHQFGIYRTPDLPVARRWPLSEISCTAMGAPRRGAIQCHSHVRAHRRRVVRRALGWHVRVGTLSRRSRIRLPWPNRAAREGLVLAPGSHASAHNSTSRPGCGSTSLSAMTPACSAGSSGFRPGIIDAEQGGGLENVAIRSRSPQIASRDAAI